jgi:Na+:H+ antiporter, NhaA family
MTLLVARLIGAPLPGRPVHILGLGFIAGIGFTMSLFIGALAFPDPAMAAPVRMGVYAGSLIAAVAGLAILAKTLPTGDARVAGETDPTRPFIADQDEPHRAPAH